MNQFRSHLAGPTRRSILKTGAAGAMGAMMAGVPILGARAQDAVVTPKRGGHLVLGLDTASSSDKLDPAFYTESYMYTVGFQLFNTLVELGEDGKLRPSLAESWEPAAPDGSKWIFKIRRGVQFHNGKELTAADVIASIDHHRGAENPSGAKGQLLAVTDISESAPYEVTFALREGNADFPYGLSDFHLGIGPAGEDFNKGIGTGAFKLESFQPGVRTLTSRFADHWNNERGFVDSCETLAMNDATARMAALLSGQVHVINRVEPRMLGRIKAMKQVRVEATPASTMYTFPMLCNVAPFDKVEVRQALKHAIDREAILAKVLGGAGIVSNDNPIAPWNPYFSADVPKNDYDPEKARSLMAKAGVTAPIELSVSDNGFPGSVDAAQLFQVAAEKAGIEIAVNRVPSDGYWDEIWLKKPFCASNWAVRPTADAMLSLILQSDAPWNETAWKVPAFDEKLIAARSELDEAKRRVLYHDLQVMLAESGGELIPVFADQMIATSTKVGGVTSVPGGGDLSGYRIAEKVWLDA
ncbi:ABC transporter substrate-binding protein [Aureimonas sp. AU12]|uniref:ABC transporter substrate-binding protein n=1 Tax=Aureimonas sp. AU12 TaxID=1638161 RepID=UPI0007843F2E|nr:ABC transporter substrate-binding protein [Aureimonas sp. AU12]